jgi:serine/threonine-protein kinase
MNLVKGDVVDNRYEIIDVIGKGGMAVVYKATDKKLERVVTLKVMREELTGDQNFLKRFDTEARAAASLTRHPNIVGVYDVGADGNIHYIVMEYIEGKTLKQLIEEKAPFSNEEIIKISIQIAEGLKSAHNNKIVHRDIKPENILVMENGDVKVADFGIARSVSSETVSAETTLGSVHYFSPEQARGGYVDHKSDLYSLGVTIFEMATKQKPFSGETHVAVALKHLHEPTPDVKALNPNVSDHIVNIINKATEKKSINRFANAEAMIDALNDNEIPKNNSEQKIVVAAIFCSFVILFFASAYAYRKIQALIPSPAPIPSVVGEDRQIARNQFSKLGVKVIEEYVNSAEVEAGLVISVDAGGREGEIYPNDSVKLIISLGKKKVSVINVTNQDVEIAKKNLENLKLKPVVAEEHSSSTAIGIVMRQEPPIGTELFDGDEVKLYVSAGPERNASVFVPRFIGLTLSVAQTECGRIGLAPLVFNIPSESVPSGIVIQQIPEEGRTAEKDSEIALYVSSGPAPTVQPNSEKSFIIEIDFNKGDLAANDIVNLKIDAVKDGETLLKLDSNIAVSKFPYKYETKNSGTAVYNMTITHQNAVVYRGSQTIDFDNQVILE